MLTLRPYQIDIAERGTAILKEHKILYLAMEVRTGKTITSMRIADKYFEGARQSQYLVLFLTKKKVISDILSQYSALAPYSYFINVINYEQLHRYRFDPDLIICDEAHGLGQFPIPSQRTKQLKKLANGLPIIYLSGTPSPESYSQLYHQFWISSYSPWAAYKTFYKWANAGYVDVRKKYIYNRSINDYSRANNQLIQHDTGHLFISFTQEQAGFTEFVDEEVIYVRLQDRTYDLIEKLKSKRVLQGKGGVILADTAVKLMQKTHQLFSGSCLTEEGDAICFDYTKAHFIAERFKDVKVAVFYKFKAERDMLDMVFGGDITDDVDEFNNSNLVFVSQIQSGREGLNLSKAEAIVFYNIDFSAVSYWQARARLQTKDRTTPAKVYWIFSLGGIEREIYNTVMDKKDFTLSHFKKIMGSNPKSVSKRSK